MMEKLRYFLREGLRNVRSNGFVSAASIGVLTICLLLARQLVSFFREYVKVLISSGREQEPDYGLSQGRASSDAGLETAEEAILRLMPKT
jgi:hypothetical protein